LQELVRFSSSVSNIAQSKRQQQCRIAKKENGLG
jgi:hypothetical protein